MIRLIRFFIIDPFKKDREIGEIEEINDIEE
jgi:hypothetical protein